VVGRLERTHRRIHLRSTPHFACPGFGFGFGSSKWVVGSADA